MGKMSAAPRYHVISLRMTNEEVAAIRNLRDDPAQTTSDFLRLALMQFFRDVGAQPGPASSDGA